MPSSHSAANSDWEHVADFGLVPFTNRFLRTATEAEDKYHLRMEVSLRTGLVRQANPPSPEELRPRFSWIKYNETGDHLDDIADRISHLDAINPSSKIVGVTYNDDTTLERLRKRGFSRISRLDTNKDFGIIAPLAGIETIQGVATPKWAKAWREKNGPVDVLIARHIWEHSHDLHSFLTALRMLLSPSGYLVLEVPDAGPLLNGCDYTLPWEDHVSYFTPDTFASTLALERCEIVFQRTYPYALENSLVAILRESPMVTQERSSDSLERVASAVAMARAFGSRLASTRTTVQRILLNQTQTGNRIALLGAGHSAIMFINLMEVGSTVSFVVDDAPEKQGLFLPGSKLPIRPASALLDNKIGLCLLSVNHQAESRLMKRLETFTRSGGSFRSIYRNSSLSVFL